MGFFDIFKKKKKEEDLPLIARVNLAEMMKKRMEELKNNPPEVSILASADFTERSREKIRLYYIALERFSRYGSGKRIGKTIGYSCPFKAPKGMTLKEACKVVSFLSELVEKDGTVKPASETSVQIVGSYLKTLGFDKIDEKSKDYSHRHAVSLDKKQALYIDDSTIIPPQFVGTTDLFTVDGDIKLFEQSDLMDRYFDWFTGWVTENQIKDIYSRIGATSLLPQNKKEDNSNQR
jgi:hypothetical protein